MNIFDTLLLQFLSEIETEHYSSQSQESPENDRHGLIADILTHIYGDDALTMLDDPDKYAWKEDDHIRDSKGRFAEKHTAESLAAVHSAIKSALSGQRSATSAGELADHLGKLTVQQLQDLKAQHNIQGAGRNKAALVAKLADRLDRGRRETHRDAASNRLRDAVKDLPKAQQADYLDSVNHVLDSMPAAAHERLSAGLGGAQFHATRDQLHQSLAGLSSKAKAAIEKGREVGGAYNHNTGMLMLDGGRKGMSQTEIYAHEMMHAVDGKSGKLLTETDPDWKAAFAAEGSVSKYGNSSPTESFAEFGRLLYGLNVDPKTLQDKFPRSMAFLGKHGLLPESSSKPQPVNEIFEESINDGGVHSDGLAKKPTPINNDPVREVPENLFNDHKGLVESIVKKFTNGRNADDLRQEGNIALWQAAQSFNPEGGAKFSTWAYKAVQNAVGNVARKDTRQKRGGGKTRQFETTEDGSSEESQVSGGLNNPLDEASSAEEQASLMKAVGGLDKKTQGMLADYFANGMTIDDLAEKHGVSKQAVSQKLKRTTEKLQAFVAGEQKVSKPKAAVPVAAKKPAPKVEALKAAKPTEVTTWESMPKEGREGFEGNVLQPLRDQVKELDDIANKKGLGSRYAWEAATRKGQRPGDKHAGSDGMSRWVSAAKAAGISNAQELADTHPELKTLQGKLDAHRAWGDEPFALQQPRKERRKAKFDAADQGPQGALFDAGKNDLEGQNLLFNTDPGAGNDPSTMESKMQKQSSNLTATPAAKSDFKPLTEKKTRESSLEDLHPRIRSAVSSVADEWGVDPEKLLDLAGEQHELNLQDWETREGLKKYARKTLGINQRTTSNTENRRSKKHGEDFANKSGVDQVVTEAQSLFPGFNWGSDPARSLMEAINEGAKPMPKMHDKNNLDSAASYLQRTYGELEAAPFHARHWVGVDLYSLSPWELDRYSHTQDEQKAQLIADILTHVYGGGVNLDSVDQYAFWGTWMEDQHPRDRRGRFAKKESRFAEASAKIAEALKSQDAIPAADMADMLGNLSVKDLISLKKAHGIKASGRKADLVSKIAGRLESVRQTKLKGDANATQSTAGGDGRHLRGPGDGGTVPGRARKGVRGNSEATPILTDRPEFTAAANAEELARVPERLTEHLTPAQREGAAKAIAAMDKHGGFLNADGTGVGKTRQILTVAQRYADDGKKVVIVAPAGVIKQDWKKGTFEGSYAQDGQAMGVKPSLTTAESPLKSGEIAITTYENLKHLKKHTDADTVVIFDESHAMKNSSTQRGKAGRDVSFQAGAVMYATATPADKPLHIAHLIRAGVFGNKSATAKKFFGKAEDTYRDLGLVKQTIYNRHAGREVTVWKAGSGGNAESIRRMQGLFDQMTKEGLMIQRTLSMDNVYIQQSQVKLPPQVAKQVQDVYEKNMRDNDGNRAVALLAARHAQEPHKIPAVVEHVKAELAAGRAPIVFLGRVNDSASMKDADDDKPFVDGNTARQLREALIAAGIPESDIGELHGAATPTAEKQRSAMKKFNAGKTKLLNSTTQSGGTGVNLDDTVGDRPRTVIMMTPPLSANDMVQAVGRINRLSTKSDAKVINLTTDHEIDQWNMDLLERKLATLGAVSARPLGKLVGDEESGEQEPFRWPRKLTESESKQVPRPSSVKPEAKQNANTSASFAKWQGDWALRVTGPVEAGQSVTVKKKDGSTQTKKVKKVLKEYDDATIVSFYGSPPDEVDRYVFLDWENMSPAELCEL